MTQSVAIAAHEVTVRFGSTLALDRVSVDVGAGEALALVGQSGSGKTTLLRCFNRMVEPSTGRVDVGGRNVASVAAIALRRSIGYVPQHGGLLPHWTALENASLVPRLTSMPNASAAGAEALAMVGLPPDRYGSRFPGELSGGQRQRVALARALAARQQLVLLDEPFGALDAVSRSEVQETLASVQHTLGLTVLLVTHDLAEAARLATRLAVMRDGRVEQQGSVEEVLSRPATDYVRSLISHAVRASAGLDRLVARN